MCTGYVLSVTTLTE
jgi:hypothetical protein